MNRKPLVLTRHAENAVEERELDRSWIERAVHDPEWTVADPNREDTERRYLRSPNWRPGASYETDAENPKSDDRLRSNCETPAMTPTTKYRPEDNAAYIRLSSARVLESAEVAPDVEFDYDADGRIEALDAKRSFRATF